MRKTGNLFPLMNAAAFIRSAWPRGAAKQIEPLLGCSPRQAWRIVSTGRVPGKFRAAFFEAVRREITRNRARLARIDAQIKAIEHGETVAEARARRTESVGAAARVGARQGERAAHAAVTGAVDAAARLVDEKVRK